MYFSTAMYLVLCSHEERYIRNEVLYFSSEYQCVSLLFTPEEQCIRYAELLNSNVSGTMYFWWAICPGRCTYTWRAMYLTWLYPGRCTLEEQCIRHGWTPEAQCIQYDVLPKRNESGINLLLKSNVSGTMNYWRAMYTARYAPEDQCIWYDVLLKSNVYFTLLLKSNVLYIIQNS